MSASSVRLERLARLNRAFRPHSPIDITELFAGRQDLVSRAFRAVSTPGLHAIIYGDPGVGKTSLSKIVTILAQQPGNPKGLRALRVQCSSTDTFSTIWEKVFANIQIEEKTANAFQLDLPPRQVGKLEGLKIKTPNDVLTVMQKFVPNTSMIVIDEFDRIRHNASRLLMADTIKLFSDTSASATLIIVGVGDSVTDLISDHGSIFRNLEQIGVPPMSLPELEEIIHNGMGIMEIDYDVAIAHRAARLSSGYPYYAHLMGFHAAESAIMNDRSEVTLEDLDEAIRKSLQSVQASSRQLYEDAVRSSHPGNLFQKVLLACALARKDGIGAFAVGDVIEPLRRLTNHAYKTGAFQSHLAKFTEPGRGPILMRIGKRRSYKWRFVNPQIIPYVILRGLDDGLITDEDLVKVFS